MESQQLLEQAAGEWTGSYRLWFRPTEPPAADCDSRATVTSEQGGTGLLLRYDWEYEGDRKEGIALLGRTEEGGLQMGWSDTFHSRHGVMQCEAVGTLAAVLAHYGPAEEPWGWRTEFEMPDADTLEIRAFNILPGGEEALATEALYRRTAAAPA